MARGEKRARASHKGKWTNHVTGDVYGPQTHRSGTKQKPGENYALNEGKREKTNFSQEWKSTKKKTLEKTGGTTKNPSTAQVFGGS